jgi:small-conductance mechanosensitive channel
MNPLYIKIIETVIVFILYLVLRSTVYRLIKKTLSEKLFYNARGIIIKRAINFILLLLGISVITLIWGVNQADLAVFVGSVLAVVGVALFAQWSLLSNVTSGIILFFNHSVKIGDNIVIMEAKDYIIEGKVTNIGIFFTTLQTPDSEEITLPNNIFINKSIRKVIG